MPDTIRSLSVGTDIVAQDVPREDGGGLPPSAGRRGSAPEGLPGGVSAGEVLARSLSRLDEPRTGTAPGGCSGSLPDGVRKAVNGATTQTVIAMALGRSVDGEGCITRMRDPRDGDRLPEGPSGMAGRSVGRIPARIGDARTEGGDGRTSLSVDEALFRAVQSLTEPLRFEPSGRPVEELSEEAGQLSGEIRSLLDRRVVVGDGSVRSREAEDEEAVREELRTLAVLRKNDELRQVQLEQEGRQAAAEAGEAIRLSRRQEDPEAALRPLELPAGTLLEAEGRQAALAVLRDPSSDEAARSAARKVLEETPAIPEEALRDLRSGFNVAAAEAFRGLLPGLTLEGGPRRAELFGSLALAVRQSGVKFVDFGRALGRGLQAGPGALVSPDRLEAWRGDVTALLADAVATARGSGTPADRRAVFELVDFIFSQGLPELADDALAVKMALVPGHAEDARLQHAVMMAHRSLMKHVLDGASPKGASGMTDAIRSMLGSGSMRSFLLMPDTVRQVIERRTRGGGLEGRAGARRLEELNYQIANLVVLERQAVKRGLIPLPQEDREVFLDARAWCGALGLQPWAAEYAARSEERIESGDASGLNALIGSAGFFERGLAGRSRHDEALGIRSGALGGSDTQRLLELVPGMKAARLLNRLTAQLTGLVSDRERLAGDGTLSLGERVDGRMRERTARLLERLRSRPEHAAMRDGAPEARQQAERSARERLRFNSTELARLAGYDNAVVKVRRFMQALGERQQAMQEAKAEVKVGWFGRGGGARRETARVVLEYCSLSDRLDALAEGEGTERRMLEQQRAACARKLAGVDPVRMRLSDGTGEAGTVPSHDFIMTVMRRRAEAIGYFDPKVYGEQESRARRDARELSARAGEFRTLGRLRRELFADFRKAVGAEGLRETRDTVAMAMLKVACEAPDVEDVSFLEETGRRALEEQLAAWGFPIDDPVCGAVFGMTLNAMLRPDGRIDAGAVEKLLAGSEGMPHAEGRAGVEAENVRLKAEGLGRAERRRRIEAMLQAGDAGLKEGAKRIMNLVSEPGRNFVYSKTRGVSFDSEAVYMPWSKAGDPFMQNYTWPLALRFRALGEDAFSVRRLGPSGYQVMVGRSLLGGIGGGNTFELGEFSLSAGGDVGGRKGGGLVLDFPDQKSCEAFVACALRGGSVKRDELDRALLGAGQIRFVDEKGVEADVNAYLCITALSSPALEGGRVGVPTLSVRAGVGLSAGLALSGELVRNVQRNARGSVITLSRSGVMSLEFSAGLQAYVSDAVKDGQGESESRMELQGGSEKLRLSRTFECGGRSEMRLVTNEQGLSPESGTATAVTLTRPASGSSLVRRLFTPQERARLQERDPGFIGRFGEFLDGTGEGDVVRVERRITPEALEAVRREMVAARSSARRTDMLGHLEHVSRILNAPESYRPYRLVVTGASTQELVSRSPGLGFLQYVRQNQATTTEERSIEIGLE